MKMAKMRKAKTKIKTAEIKNKKSSLKIKRKGKCKIRK